MIKANHVLLASHGTEGAQAAERMAIQEYCAAGAMLHHLFVVPSFWRDMTGDDWLNNGSTRDVYRRYLESELGKEADQCIERVKSLALANGLEYQSELMLGEPRECLLNAVEQQAFDLIVVGSSRPRHIPGLRSRMLTSSLSRLLQDKMIVAPYPHDSRAHA